MIENELFGGILIDFLEGFQHKFLKQQVKSVINTTFILV